MQSSILLRRYRTASYFDKGSNGGSMAWVTKLAVGEASERIVKINSRRVIKAAQFFF